MKTLFRMPALILLGTGALLAAAAVTPLLRADPAPPAAQERKDQDQDEEEEHGGDVVFHVVSRSQKYSVLYSHQAHLDAGLKCEDCHESIFKKEFEGNHFKMSDINKGQACGVCHQAEPPDGVKGAFAPKRNCSKCHVLRVREPEVK